MSEQVLTPVARSEFSIPDYELLRSIGHGAYGEVWLARNLTGSLVALKIVRRAAFDHDRPFEREFEGIKRFEPISRSDPSQVAILHVGRGEGFFYYVMELADDATGAGEKVGKWESGRAEIPPAHFPTRSPANYSPLTLKRLMNDCGALPAVECVTIALSLTRALAHLHGHGLVHRDVKPSNVIFVKGVAKLADIGLVTSVDATRSFVGTEGYLPPEGAGTPSADCYSLGKLLYELSTGHDRASWPEPPADLATLPDRERLLELNAILHKACAPEPRERYRMAEEMRFELDLLQSGGSVKRKRTVRQLWAVGRKAGLVFFLLALLASGVLALRRRVPDRDERSANEEVNKLIEQGNYLVLSATLDEQRRALERFKRAIEIDPKSVSAQFGLLRAYWDQYPENRSADYNSNLRTTATNLMEIAPDRAEAWVAAASIKWLDHRWRDALADAKKATQMRAGSKEGRGSAHDLYGCYLVCSGHPEAALQQFQLAEQEFGADPAIQQHLGFPYFVKGEFDEALKHFQMATEAESRYEGGHYWSGRVYEEKEDFEKAINEFEEFDRVIGTHKGQPFYDDLRQAFRQGGGEAYWNKRLQTTMSASHPYAYSIATLLARLGRKDEAYARLKEADKKGEIEPGNLVFDLCWDRNDERFKAIARKNGLTLR